MKEVEVPSVPTSDELVEAFKAVLNDWEPENDGGVYRHHWEKGWAAIEAYQKAIGQEEFWSGPQPPKGVASGLPAAPQVQDGETKA